MRSSLGHDLALTDRYAEAVSMSNGRKLIAIFLLIAGVSRMFDTVLQNIFVSLPIGLAVFLYGLFWLFGV